MPGIAARLQGIVQIAHELRRLEIRRVFGVEAMMGVAGDEGEMANEFVKVGQREFDARWQDG